MRIIKISKKFDRMTYHKDGLIWYQNRIHTTYKFLFFTWKYITRFDFTKGVEAHKKH